MAVCAGCHHLLEDDRVLCPFCYHPVRQTTPIAQRRAAVIALVFVLAAVAILLRLLVYRLP